MIPSNVQKEILGKLPPNISTNSLNVTVVLDFSNFSVLCKNEGLTSKTFNRLRNQIFNENIKNICIDNLNKSNKLNIFKIYSSDSLNSYGININIYNIEPDKYHENIQGYIIRTNYENGYSYLSRYSKENKSEKFCKNVFKLELAMNNYNIEKFSELTSSFLRKIQDTIYIYNYNEFTTILNWFKRVSNIKISSETGEIYNTRKVTNLISKDTVWGGIVGGKEIYTITPKADGERHFMVFGPNGIWFLNPPHSFIRVSKNCGHFQGIILDGELLTKDRRKNLGTGLWFLINDAITYKSSSDIQERPHSSRMLIARKVTQSLENNQIFSIWTKTFVSFKTVNEFFSATRTIIEQLDNMPYDTDGLIFTPEFASYLPKFNGKVKSLTVSPGLRKWKPLKDQTLDLLVRRDKDNIISLYCSVKGEIVKFNGTPKHRLNKENIETLLLKNVPNESVIEFSWNPNTKKLQVYRFREDKIFPNSIEACLNVWSNIFELTNDINTMLGKGAGFLRYYHQRIKRDLYNSISGKTLIDIGSGFGYDAQYWGKFNKVICIEPNENMTDDLAKNTSEININDKIQIIVTGGEDYKTISKQSLRIFNEKVDAISFMFSLGLFWGIENGLVNICKTINTSLKVGGEIIFFGFDGYCIEQMFNPMFGGVKEFSNTLEFAKNKIVWDPEKLTVTVNDFTEKVMWVEELCDLYKEMYPSEELKISWKFTSDREKLLSVDELNFSRLFSFGRLRRIYYYDYDL